MSNKLKRIYRTYSDTEITELSTYIECPYCGESWLEPDTNECGKTYTLTCENENCEKQFEMYFDAD